MKSAHISLAGIAMVAAAALASPYPNVVVHTNEARVEFPQSITFQLELSSEVTIRSVELEFRTDAMTCGQSVSKAIPENFVPTSEVDVEWEWNLRRAGVLPPGTVIWWRWVLEDANGDITELDEQSVVFEDPNFTWQHIEDGNLVLFWYSGSKDFAQRLLDAGRQGVDQLELMTGVQVERPVQIYIYDSPESMQAATLFSPEWGGGLAFPRHSKVIIGISPSELSWGIGAVKHELSHVLIGYYTFSCVNSTPIWVDEGLAMYSEGELDPYSQDLLQSAIDQDNLLSTRELGQIFSESPDLARLAYAESYSLVSFLLEDFGSDAMLNVLTKFKQGASVDRALESVYGFDRDGLDAAWRAWVGAQVHEMSAGEMAEATVTIVPTLAPITGPVLLTTTPSVPEEAKPTPTAPEATATLSYSSPATSGSGSGSPGLAWILIPAGIIVVGIILFAYTRSRASK
jgi:hypothetical protein